MEVATRTGSRNIVVRCCACRCCTPFVFYVISKAALEAAKIHPRHNFYCAECLPKPSPTEGSDALEMYPPGSLLNNPEILLMFYGFKYYSSSHSKDAIDKILVINDYTRIHGNYKKIARKPMPAKVKMDKIFRLFPPVHQMPWKVYDTAKAMYEDLRGKAEEIFNAYETNPASEYFDNIDLMIDRTPQLVHSQAARNRSRGNFDSFVSDVYEMRANDSDVISQTSIRDETPTLEQISSESIGNHTFIPESQSMMITNPSIERSNVPDRQHVFDSMDISSQSTTQDASQDGGVPKLPIFSTSSTISSQPSYPSTVVESSGKRSLQSAGDSQEAGPSGIQQQKTNTAKAKRRRLDIPVNPTPEEAQSSRTSSFRMPRLPGG